QTVFKSSNLTFIASFRKKQLQFPAFSATIISKTHVRLWRGCRSIQTEFILFFFFWMLVSLPLTFFVHVIFSPGQKMTMQSYNLLILAAWLNAVFWSSMPIVGWAGYAPDPTGATCTINWRQNDASFVSYTMAVIAVNFVVPLTVMFYCYYNVSATVKRYKASNCLDSINIDWSDQMDVTKMSIVMIVMFLVAWSPYSMVCLWASFGDPKTIPAPMAIIAPLFAKSSTFYNPCIYVIANKKFRRAIIGMIRCQTRQRITISTQVPMTISQQPLTQ
uniref:Retinal pigment epithelium-derived rhodopsin homolog n=1 Tax=Oryzias sinensis TaxID=183150 RepID=A0A8C7XGP6_9TELE